MSTELPYLLPPPPPPGAMHRFFLRVPSLTSRHRRGPRVLLPVNATDGSEDPFVGAVLGHSGKSRLLCGKDIVHVTIVDFDCVGDALPFA